MFERPFDIHPALAFQSLVNRLRRQWRRNAKGGTLPETPHYVFLHVPALAKLPTDDPRFEEEYPVIIQNPDGSQHQTFYHRFFNTAETDMSRFIRDARWDGLEVNVVCRAPVNNTVFHPDGAFCTLREDILEGPGL